MASTVKSAREALTSKKRKSSGSNTNTPKSNKKQKHDSPLPESDSEPDPFEPSLVPRKYKAKRNEVLYEFDEIARGQSLPSQAQDFYKNARRIAIKSNTEMNWESLRRYKVAATQHGGKKIDYSVGEDVLIQQKDRDDSNCTEMIGYLKGNWVARILDIRARDEFAVYILVNWYNRPEDLLDWPGQPGGRQPHHGMRELIATNHVDVIETTTLQGQIDVTHWVESDESEPPEGKLFWRQCLAIESGKYSKLKTVCICDAPANPDKNVIHCSACDTWMHDECMVEALVKQEALPKDGWERVGQEDEDGNLLSKFRLAPKSAKPWVVTLDGEKGLFVSADREGKQWQEQMNCLKCGTWLK